MAGSLLYATVAYGMPVTFVMNAFMDRVLSSRGPRILGERNRLPPDAEEGHLAGRPSSQTHGIAAGAARTVARFTDEVQGRLWRALDVEL
jgi:hypothetical protein